MCDIRWAQGRTAARRTSTRRRYPSAAGLSWNDCFENAMFANEENISSTNRLLHVFYHLVECNSFYAKKCITSNCNIIICDIWAFQHKRSCIQTRPIMTAFNSPCILLVFTFFSLLHFSTFSEERKCNLYSWYMHTSDI